MKPHYPAFPIEENFPGNTQDEIDEGGIVPQFSH
jgi:hypothetical protein